jgi:hypothetical protein
MTALDLCIYSFEIAVEDARCVDIDQLGAQLRANLAVVFAALRAVGVPERFIRDAWPIWLESRAVKPPPRAPARRQHSDDTPATWPFTRAQTSRMSTAGRRS